MATELKDAPAKQAYEFTLPMWMGKIVLYYPHADRSSTPAPAIVQKWDRRGVCTLSVVSENMLSVKAVHGARYMQDPGIETWHEDARNSCGGWDLVDPERAALVKPPKGFLPPLKS